MQEKYRYYTLLEQKAKDTCPLLSLEETHLLLKNIIDADLPATDPELKKQYLDPFIKYLHMVKIFIQT